MIHEIENRVLFSPPPPRCFTVKRYNVSALGSSHKAR